MKEITKKYVKDELTIAWKPHMCIHSAICFHGLPQVFDPRVRPWISPGGASKEVIVDQIKKCPSGAISYSLNNQEMENDQIKIEVRKQGPLLVKGTFVLIDENGKEEIKTGNLALCRCGGSKNKPFCDGEHRSNNVLS